MELQDYYNLHDGQTCVIASVGPNLPLTPPEWFNYPSFGVNTIYHYTKLTGWKPTYFVGVDERLWREDGAAILETYPEIPKFIPSPDRDTFKGENFLRFHHRPGEMFIGGQSPRDIKALTQWGISYRRILDAVFQIAFWMGFTRMLLVGVQHKPGTRKEHFWGTASHDPAEDFKFEEAGYAECIRMMGSRVTVLNLSEDTYVPESVLPRDDWRKWRNV